MVQELITLESCNGKKEASFVPFGSKMMFNININNNHHLYMLQWRFQLQNCRFVWNNALIVGLHQSCLHTTWHETTLHDSKRFDTTIQYDCWVELSNINEWMKALSVKSNNRAIESSDNNKNNNDYATWKFITIQRAAKMVYKELLYHSSSIGLHCNETTWLGPSFEGVSQNRFLLAPMQNTIASNKYM